MLVFGDNALQHTNTLFELVQAGQFVTVLLFFFSSRMPHIVYFSYRLGGHDNSDDADDPKKNNHFRNPGPSLNYIKDS